MSLTLPFYHGTLRRYVVAFGSLFSQISIERDDANNDRVQTLLVPFAYASKDKVYARSDQNPKLDKDIAIQLPRMSFVMKSLDYDNDRKQMNSIQWTNPSADPNKFKRAYSPVPYRLGFELYIYTKNEQDGLKILEQIVPFFQPALTLTLNILPEVGAQYDTPITLNGINFQDDFEGDFLQRKFMVWTLSFSIPIYLFGPVVGGAIIKQVIANIAATSPGSVITDEDLDGATTRVRTVPGLTTDGTPTSNSAASIPYRQISANSDYGIVQSTEDITS